MRMEKLEPKRSRQPSLAVGDRQTDSRPTDDRERTAEAIRVKRSNTFLEISDVNIDFQILPTVREEDERADNQMDVLLVAAKKAKIRDYTHLLSMAGLNPVVMDIDVFALENEYEMSTADDLDVVALVDIGATTMNINILKAGYTMFQRDIAIGGNRYTSTIQKELKVSYDEAEALKLGVGLTDRRGREEILSIMVEISEEIAEEMQRSFEFSDHGS